MSCPSTYTCSIGHVVPFAANPDVAGIGVILAFTISACIAFSTVVIAYIFVDPLDTDSRNFYDDIARLPIQKAASRLRLQQRMGSPRLKTAIQKVAVILSDQQLITGAAILVVGYIQHCEISQYHYEIANNLSWLAFSTIEATIDISEAQYHWNPAMRLWRAVWITALFLFIIISNLIVYNAAFLVQYGVSTQCVWDQLASPYAYAEKAVEVNSTAPLPNGSSTSTGLLNQTGSATSFVFDYYLPQYTSQHLATMILVDLLLLWGLATMLQTFYRWKWSWMDRVQRWVHTLVRSLIFLERMCSRRIRSRKVKQRRATAVHPAVGQTVIAGVLWLLHLCAFAAMVLAITIQGLLSSKLLDYMRLLVFIVFSITDTFALKVEASNQGMNGDENQWGFGQIFPVLLLALPLTSIFETVQSAGFISNPRPTKMDEVSTDPDECMTGDATAEAASQAPNLPDDSLFAEALAFERDFITRPGFKLWIVVFSWGIFMAIFMLAVNLGYYI